MNAKIKEWDHANWLRMNITNLEDAQTFIMLMSLFDYMQQRCDVAFAEMHNF